MMVSRLRTQLNQEDGFRELDKVVEKYGRIEGEPFSFANHEFQREIVRDTSSRIYVRKCSQVGLSEAAAQKILAMCAVLKHKRIIFTLPVLAMSTKFSKDRIDSIIEQSEYYSGLVVKANNSASLKRIGTCSLYIGGTFGSTGAISVPAEILFNDEVDFSNPVVLGKLSSRLRHASKDERGYSGTRIMFSTPTVDDYGIDSYFKRGHQAYYLVKCKHCGSWEVPDFLADFVIPGMDKPIIELERRDMHNAAYRFQEAWIKCPGCGGDLWSSLLDPERRQWVAKHPDRWEKSYQVSPWDVPAYNTPASIIQQFEEYRDVGDYFNFVIGTPHTSADNSFIVSDEHRDRVGDAELWIFQQHVMKSATVGGLDVGKTSHLVVLTVAGTHEYVVWAEAIPNTLDKPATEAVLERVSFFNMTKLVVDAGPDITLVNQLIGARHLGAISACQYVRSVPGLDIISEHDDGALIKADRSKTLGETMKAHNAGRIHYPRQLVDKIFSHLKTVKKVKQMDAQGDQVERFEAMGEDHYCHALNYARIAKMALEEFASGPQVAMPPTVGRFKIGANATGRR